MTNKEAYDLIDQATQPENAGRLKREGYAQVERALGVLKALVDKADAPKEP